MGLKKTFACNLDAKKPVFGFAHNKGPDLQVICTLVIWLLESSISKLATGKISILYLVPKAEETGLSISLSETPDRFSCDEAHICWALFSIEYPGNGIIRLSLYYIQYSMIVLS